jgi:hypothetical protein
MSVGPQRIDGQLFSSSQRRVIAFERSGPATACLVLDFIELEFEVEAVRPFELQSGQRPVEGNLPLEALLRNSSARRIARNGLP